MYIKKFTNISQMRDYLGDEYYDPSVSKRLFKTGLFRLVTAEKGSRCRSEFAGYILNPATGDCNIKLSVKEVK